MVKNRPACEPGIKVGPKKTYSLSSKKYGFDKFPGRPQSVNCGDRETYDFGKFRWSNDGILLTTHGPAFNWLIWLSPRLSL